VGRLIAAGVDGRDDAGTMFAAARHGRLAAARLLLDAGFPVSWAGADGLTALHLAAHHGQRRVVEELVARGAPLDVRDAVYGGTPLGRVAWLGKRWPTPERADVQRFLVARSNDVFDVVFAGSAERLAPLLAEDPSRARRVRPNGVTPLHVLVEADVPDPLPLIDLLRRHGAPVDARDAKGRTPRDIAVELELPRAAAAL
jgi:ankyrin repeat protein